MCTDYALARWMETAPPTTDQFRAAFAWVLQCIEQGPHRKLALVQNGQDMNTAVLVEARVAIQFNVYPDKNLVAVLDFSTY